MTVTLPGVIERYVAASAARAIDDVVACFTDDAVVTDDGKTMHGRAEIREWREGVVSTFRYTTTFLKATNAPPPAEGLEGHDVRTRLDGDFPGSPVELTSQFGLRDGLIATLDIAP